MAMFIRQDSTRSKLQQKVAADLAEKAKKKAAESDAEQPDGVDDSQFLKDTKRTTSLAWIWLLVFIAIVGIVVWLVVASS